MSYSGISQYGLEYWERRRGAFKKEDCHEWLRSLLRAVPHPAHNVVVVCDNAPCHSQLEEVCASIHQTHCSLNHKTVRKHIKLTQVLYLLAYEHCNHYISTHQVVLEDEFLGAGILRLAPYSAPLNPIEEVWSVVKSHMKREMSESRGAMLNSRPCAGTTLVEHRLQYLERVIDNNIPINITPGLCIKVCNHVQKHFAPCLQRQDLFMGDIPTIVM